MSESGVPGQPAIVVDPAVKEVLESLIAEESQVIVHCTFRATGNDDVIRIWKSTFLVPEDANHRSKLLHVENITVYPFWMAVPKDTVVSFTLIFAALPKDCRQFDLIEEIPENGGFEIRNIARNSMDVYSLNLV